MQEAVSFDDSIRRQFRAVGADHMSDHELLSLVLASSTRKASVAASSLLQRFGGFEEAICAPRDAFAGLNISDRAIDVLKSVHEAAVRLTRDRVNRRDILSSGQRVLDYCRSRLGYADTEEFHILFLDRKNGLIAAERQSRGTVDHTPVYVREVVKRALQLNATAILLTHNHPSGDPSPSKADIEMTREIIRACSALGLSVHDHIIVTRCGHTSLKSMGVI